jgi:hypothetical protein
MLSAVMLSANFFYTDCPYAGYRFYEYCYADTLQKTLSMWPSTLGQLC